MSELPPFDQDLTLPDDPDKDGESSDLVTQLSSPTQFMPPLADETEGTAAPSTMFETQLGTSQPTIGYIQRPSTEIKPRSNGRMAIAAIGFIVLALFGLALFLPPISILDQLEDDDRTLDSGNFAPLNEKKPQSIEGLTFAVSDEGEADDFEVRVSHISVEDYERNRLPESNWQCEAATLLPSSFHPVGDVYSIETRGYPPSELQLRLAVESGFSVNQVDWYGFDPALSRWRFLPIQYLAEQNVIQTRVQRLPTCLLTTQVETSTPIVGVSIESQQDLPENTEASTRLLYSRGLHPVSNGGVVGVLSSGINRQNPYKVIPIISNAINAHVTDVQTVEMLLADPALRTEHVTQLINLAVENDYDGIAIDYHHLPDTTNMRDQFSAFLLDLGRGLRLQGRVLIVVLPWPTQQDGEWQSGAYDWARIGQIADEIILKTPLDPLAFSENGDLVAALGWITQRVSRQRLFLEISASTVQTTSDGVTLPIEDAIGGLSFSGQIELNPALSTYTAGDTFTAQLSSSYQIQPSWDVATQTLAIRQVENDSPTQTQWIMTPQTLQFRKEMAGRYGLGGVIFSDVFDGESGAELWLAFQNLADESADETPSTPSATLFWTVRDVDGNILSSVASQSLTYTIAENETTLDITAQLQINNRAIPIAQETIDLTGTEVVAVPDENTSPSESDTTDEGIDNDTDGITSDEGDNSDENVEENTTSADDESPETQTDVEDGSSAPTVDESDEDSESIDDDSSDVDSVTDDGDDGTSESSTTPPPTSTMEFQLGGQIEQFSDEAFGILAQTHMTWIGWQVPYNLGASPEILGSLITRAHNEGYKILIRVSGLPTTLADPSFNEAFAQYVGGLAELGADAIEIWNAPNSSANWIAGQIAPRLYVDLVGEASAAIRSANPETIIISAALQPSIAVQGEGQSDTLWNDDVYRAGMAQAGIAEYIDCIGVRYIQGTVPPDTTSGDPRGNASIYYLPSLIDRVYTAFDRTLPICFTSFGYLSGDGYGDLPVNLQWADGTSSQNQADWLAQAVTMNADSGTVYLMIVWNIDFKFSSDRAEGYALVRGDDSCPACVTLGALSP